MRRNRTKTCCHCGSVTHPQPQDYNHDTGYGHCYACLNKPNWYVPNTYQLAPRIRLTIWERREANNAPLTSDDSHGKVIELEVCNHLDLHLTTYKTKPEILEWINRKVKTFENPTEL